MHIDTAALAAVIRHACAELRSIDVGAAAGEIGRHGACRVLLRIEPDRSRAGREIPLPPGAEDVMREVEAAPDTDANIAAVLAELEGAAVQAAGIRSALNACCYRDVCRELLLSLQIILENPDHDLLPTEREPAEAAIRRAMGEGEP